MVEGVNCVFDFISIFMFKRWNDYVSIRNLFRHEENNTLIKRHKTFVLILMVINQFIHNIQRKKNVRLRKKKPSVEWNESNVKHCGEEKKCVLGGDKVKTEFSFPLFYAFSAKSASKKKSSASQKKELNETPSCAKTNFISESFF